MALVETRVSGSIYFGTGQVVDAAATFRGITGVMDIPFCHSQGSLTQIPLTL